MTDRQQVEAMLGRALHKYEEVYYLNDCPWDNSPANLGVKFQAQAAGRTQATEKKKRRRPRKGCVICGELMEVVGPRINAKTCSPKCKAAYLSILNRKPAMPNSLYNPEAPPSRADRRLFEGPLPKLRMDRYRTKGLLIDW